MKLVVYDARVTVSASDITTLSRIEYLRKNDKIVVRKGTDEVPNTMFRRPQFADMAAVSPLEVIKVYGTGTVIVDTSALSRYTLKLIAISNSLYDEATIKIQGSVVHIPRVAMEACNGLVYGFPVIADNLLQVCHMGSGTVQCTRQPGCLLNESGQSVTVHTEQ
jgi:hypothetical protein